MPAVFPKSAADQAVSFFAVHHDCTNCSGICAHDGFGQIRCDAFTFHQLVIAVPVIVVAWVVFRVHDLEVLTGADGQTGALATSFDHFRAANQDWGFGGFFKDCLSCAQDTLIFTFREHNAPRGFAGGFEYRAHQQRGFENRLVEFVDIGVDVVDRAGCYTAVHGGFGHGRGNHAHQARIKRFWDQIFCTKCELFAFVCGSGFGRGGGARKFGDAVHAGNTHLIVDLSGAHIQRAAENEREAEDIVDLIGEVRTACGNDRIGCNLAGQFGHDFRGWVGEGKDDRLCRHLFNQVRFQHARTGEAEEHVRALHHIFQRAQVCFLGKFCFLRVHVLLAAFINKTVDVAEPDVLAFHPQFDEHIEAGNACCAAAGGDNFDVFEVFICDLQRVGCCGPHNNGGAVLVVMEHRDVHALAAEFFHDKALWRLDVFEVDSPKSWPHGTDDVGELFRVCLVQFDVKAVDIGKFLEEHRFALHHWFGRQCTDVSEAEHSRPVGHHCHEVLAGGVEGCVGWVLFDLEAGFCHARGVGTGQVATVGQRLGGADLEFPRLWVGVVEQSGVTQRLVAVVGHSGPHVARGAEMNVGVVNIWFSIKLL